MWNYFDIPALAFPLAVSIMEIIAIYNIKPNPNPIYTNKFDSNYNVLRVLTGLAVFFTWIKLLFFGRGFKNIAFLIKMIMQVMVNMKYFFIVTFYSLIAFSFLGYFLFVYILYNYNI